MSTHDPFQSWRTRPLPEYHKPEPVRCICGRPLNQYNVEDGLCCRCKAGKHNCIEIDPIWVALCDGAPDDRIELVASILTGDKSIRPEW